MNQIHHDRQIAFTHVGARRPSMTNTTAIMADSDVHSWEYLERLQGTEFYRLYKNPSAALAIFRKRLSSLGRSEGL